eukprot:4856854-Lingulodinium_polyedra.AAC.1
MGAAAPRRLHHRGRQEACEKAARAAQDGGAGNASTVPGVRRRQASHARPGRRARAWRLLDRHEPRDRRGGRAAAGTVGRSRRE